MSQASPGPLVVNKKKSKGYPPIYSESARRESNPRPSPWQGDIVPLYHSRTVPRTGIEPVTRGFSVLCSTDWAIWAKKRVMGIEPTCSAWKADILPLNYTRTCTLFNFQGTNDILLYPHWPCQRLFCFSQKNPPFSKSRRRGARNEKWKKEISDAQN